MLQFMRKMWHAPLSWITILLAAHQHKHSQSFQIHNNYFQTMSDFIYMAVYFFTYK